MTALCVENIYLLAALPSLFLPSGSQRAAFLEGWVGEHAELYEESILQH